jgi:ATP-binding cassette subfamily B protein
MNLYDNVIISTIDNKDRKKFIKVVEKVEIKYKSKTFPEQENTMLSRDFDGVELSGGEWQKIAISRGLYRDSEVVILDEPTAAIDPIEEVNIYKKFAEISKGKTALIITHRLGSARIADRILVMKQGEIVEEGTHDELMSNENLYYNMFVEQAKWYDKKITVYE